MELYENTPEAILEFIKKRKHVSFVELRENIKDFEGDRSWWLGDLENILLWGSLSQQSIDNLQQLLKEYKIEGIPCEQLVYIVDGSISRIPVAQKPKNYKTPHWLPIYFDAT